MDHISADYSMSKREQMLATLICEPIGVVFRQMKVDQRFRWQPDGAVCVKVSACQWKPSMFGMKPRPADAPMSWKVFPICDLETLLDKDKQSIYHINWATKSVLFWLHNEEGIYLRMVINRPFTVDSVTEFCLEAFPDGTPEMLDDTTDEMEAVDWSDVSEILNGKSDSVS